MKKFVHLLEDEIRDKDERIAELEEAAAELNSLYNDPTVWKHDTLKQRIAELEAENRECVSVLALLRLHRLGPDTMDEPIPSDLLSREDAALANLEVK